MSPSFEELTEVLPSDTDEGAQWIFSPQQLDKINELVSNDIAALSDPNNTLYKIKTGKRFWHFNFFSKPPLSPDLEEGETAIPAPESQMRLIDIYSKLAHLLELARANPDFTIVFELGY